MEAVTYHLASTGQERLFYNDLSLFTSQYLQCRSAYSLLDVEDFINFVRGTSSNALKTFDEYYLEYLTMGTLINIYASNAMSSGGVNIAVLKGLYKYRNSIAALKPLIDKLRGILSTLVLKNKIILVKIDSAHRFKHFLKWLEATGEFSEEALRLWVWHKYMKSLNPEKSAALLDNASQTARGFEAQAKNKLGLFTRNVETFRTNMLSEHRFKENYIFCGRHEVEYHLNMFGAEILNRSLKKGFNATSKKVILFPTCMSMPLGGKCKAILKDGKLTCTGCSPNCTINIKRKEYAVYNIDVVLIPHSSEFTKYLKYWKDQDTTGLIGIACVLNLLKGGYEMQKLNIPSQCVFLDYCGCKKHWHKEGIPTNINNNQLKTVLGMS